MATTTTYWAIRDQIYLTLRAITPTLIPAHKFVRGPRDRRLMEWALGGEAHGACFRRFEMWRGPKPNASNIMDPAARELTRSASLLVAYPAKQVALFGASDLDEVERVMESDALQIYDKIFSYSNYVAGQSIARVTVAEPDRTNDAAWFQRFDLELVYTEAQSL